MPFRGGGVSYGIGVWTLSYLGWIPAARILTPSHRHPLRRNLLMMAAHVIWGLTLAKSLKEMEDTADEAFASPIGRLIRQKEQTERSGL